MSNEIRAFNCTIPPGTLITAPISIDMSFPAREVTEIDVNVPPGPSGLAGFAIGSAGTIVIPYGAQSWIVTDDEKISWPLQGYINSGSWTFFGYNLGKYAHTFYVRFLLSLLTPAVGVSTATLAQVASLSATAGPTGPAPSLSATTGPAATAATAPALAGATLPAAPIIVSRR